MEFEGQLNEDDMVRAFHLHSRDQFRKAAKFLFTVCAFILIIQVWLPPPRLWHIGIALGGPALMLYYRHLLVPRLLRKEFRQNVVYGSPFRTEVDDSGFVTVQHNDQHKRSWPEIRGWREDGNYFLLYESDDVYRVLPKRYLKNEVETEELRALLSAKIGKKM